MARLSIFCISIFLPYIISGQANHLNNYSNFEVIEKLYQTEKFDSCLVLTSKFIDDFNDGDLSDTINLLYVLVMHGHILSESKSNSQLSNESQFRVQDILDSHHLQLEDLKLESQNLLIINHIKLKEYKQARYYTNLSSDLISEKKMENNLEIARNQIFTGALLMYEHKNDEAESTIKDAKKIYRDLQDTMNLQFANSGIYLANVLRILGKYDESLMTSKNSIAMIRELKGDNNLALPPLYTAISNTYMIKGNMHQAFRYQKMALENLINNNVPDSISLAGIYTNMGTFAQFQDDYFMSIEYINKAIGIYRRQKGDKFAGLIPPNYNIAISYHSIKYFEKALKHLQIVKDLIKNYYGSQHLQFVQVLTLESMILGDKSAYEESIEVINEAKSIYNKIEAHDLIAWSNLLNLEARANKKIGQSDVAKKIYFENIELARNELKEDKKQGYESYLNLSEIFIQEGDLDRAMAYNDTTLSKLVVNYDLNDLSTLFAPIHYLKTNAIRSDIFYKKFLLTNEKGALQLAYENDIESLNFIKQLLNYTAKKNTDEFIRGEYQWIFENMLRHAHSYFVLNNDRSTLNFAFQIFELNKYYTLLRNFIDRKEVKFVNIDLTLKKKEEDILNALRLYNNRKEKLLEKIDLDPTEYADVSDSLNYYKKEFDLHKEILKKNHKNYYDQKYRSEFANIEELKDLLLNSNTCIVEYFLGDSSIFSMIIDEDQAIFEHDLVDDFFLDRTRCALKKIKQFRSNEPNGDSCINYLSDYLIGGKAKNLNKYQNIIIVPDGILGYVPFELLVNEDFIEEEFNNTGLWGLSHNLSYAYSASLYKEQMSRSKNRKSVFNGFAAEYTSSSSDSLAKDDHSLLNVVTRAGALELPFALEEVMEISKLVGGQVYSKNEASKQNFIEHSKNMNLIHLAMHTVVSDSAPLETGFIFTEVNDTLSNVLTIAELYGLEMNTDLVVLAACQTGDGSYKKGEGITSLANAFTHAGVNSSLMSLWNVPDNSTKKIMIEFYRGLKKGLPKNEALRQAKLHYLEQTIEPQERAPYYWAGFVLQGDIRPIIFKSRSYGLFYILGTLFMISIGLWLYRNNNQRTN